jgi:hypothetical protein
MSWIVYGTLLFIPLCLILVNLVNDSWLPVRQTKATVIARIHVPPQLPYVFAGKGQPPAPASPTATGRLEPEAWLLDVQESPSVNAPLKGRMYRLEVSERFFRQTVVGGKVSVRYTHNRLDSGVDVLGIVQ